MTFQEDSEEDRAEGKDIGVETVLKDDKEVEVKEAAESDGGKTLNETFNLQNNDKINEKDLTDFVCSLNVG